MSPIVRNSLFYDSLKRCISKSAKEIYSEIKQNSRIDKFEQKENNKNSRVVLFPIEMKNILKQILNIVVDRTERFSDVFSEIPK